MKVPLKEISSTFRTVEEIRSGIFLFSCYYLCACIDKAMRFSLTVGGILLCEVLRGGISEDSHHFPSGTILGTPCYAVHHHSIYYSSTFLYKPERWLVSESKGVSTKHVALVQSAFCLFGIGPRTCAGRYMVYTKMGVVVVRLVWLFEMRLAQDPDLKDHTNEASFLKVMCDRAGYASIDKLVSKSRGPFIEIREKERLECGALLLA